jgi:hypothetical protein
MSDRDELAKLIADWFGDDRRYFSGLAYGTGVSVYEPYEGEGGGVSFDTSEIADAIIAAGWRAPEGE